MKRYYCISNIYIVHFHNVNLHYKKVKLIINSQFYLLVNESFYTLKFNWGSRSHCFHGNSCQVVLNFLIKCHKHLIHQACGVSMLFCHHIAGDVRIKRDLQQMQHRFQAREIVELGIRCPEKIHNNEN